MVTHNLRQQRGVVAVMVAIALVALLGLTALTVDIGRVALAAQRAQEVADAAALAAASQPLHDSPTETYARLNDTVEANNESSGLEVTWAQEDVVFYQGGNTVPGYGVLGDCEEGVTVVSYVEVPYHFACVFGMSGTTVTRAATAARVFAGGAPICPMWVSHETDYLYGQTQELPMGDAAAANTAGNFGLLEPPTGSTDFLELLRGYNLPRDMIIGNYVEAGDIITGYTGVSIGQWRAALAQSNDGLARLERATWEPWAGDTFESYHRDNPRIIIVPMCRYLDGTGSGARYEIMRFGAFWLESAGTTESKGMTGRFIEFQTPGGGEDPLAELTGLWTTRLVH